MATDPLDLFRRALDALRAEDWQGLAALCDAASLASFRDHLAAQFDWEGPSREQLLESRLRHFPDMPEAVAAYEADRMLERSTPEARLREDLPTVASVEALRGMSPEAVFAAWLDGRSVRRHLEADAEARNVPPEVVERVLADATELYADVALGAVYDGPRIAYVIYRPRLEWDAGDAGVAQPTHVSALACRRDDEGAWRLVASDQLFQLGSTLFAFGEPAADEQEEA